MSGPSAGFQSSRPTTLETIKPMEPNASNQEEIRFVMLAFLSMNEHD
jgi:hypothetical protein